MARVYRLIVGQAERAQRLDRYLVQHAPQTLSRAAIQRAIEQGGVTVDGQPAKAHRRLTPGQVVEARFDQLPQPSRGMTIVPEAIPLDVVFEDDQVLAVNKPPGLVAHPAPGHWSGTLVNAVAWHLQSGQGSRVKGQGEDPSLHPSPFTLHPLLPRAGLVHRLDKDTSGLLVIAKTELALRVLARQLKARTISRRYLALVDGHLPYDEGTIDASIGRHLKDRKIMTVRFLGGRQAVTHYKVLARLSVQGSPAGPYTLVEVALETGRTHQIRVHLAHLGHPVLGDSVYSRHPASYWSALGIHRQLLHAYAIRFLHPANQQRIELSIGVPDDMARWIPIEILQRFRVSAR